MLFRRFDNISAFDLLDRLVAALEITVVPFERDDSIAARSVYSRFGKGVHPAKLNLLDCVSYALAERLGMPLLYIGDDFAQTPLR